MIRPGTESTNFTRRQAVYEAIPRHPEITVLCRPAIDRAPRNCRTPATRYPRGALCLPEGFH
jgi:hypothetical protein